jgi:hypothetical protein
MRVHTSSVTWISPIALVVMVLGAAWLAVAPQAAEARGPTFCSDRLVTHNVSCNYARRVASHHVKTGDRRFNGWKCDDDMRSGRRANTTCHRYRKGGKQRITVQPEAATRTRQAALGAQTATSSTGEPVDSVKPDLQVSAKKKQNPQANKVCNRYQCDVRVKASCGDEACTARAKGKLTKVKNDKLQPDELADRSGAW